MSQLLTLIFDHSLPFPAHSLHEPEKKKEIVIPSLPNTDFRREAASRRSLYLPESGLHGQQNAGPTQPEVLGQQMTQFGLQVTKKTTTAENGSSDMQVEETVITEQETTVPTQTLEETALAALIRGEIMRSVGRSNVQCAK